MFVMALMMVITISAAAATNSYNAVKNDALFLSDKMAYELNLTPAQYEAVYEINLDYLMSISGRHDVFGNWWTRRNMDLRHVLTPWQYDKYMGMNYFYRPVAWEHDGWHFSIYSRYDRGRMHMPHPKAFASYRGGNNHRDSRFYADRHIDKPLRHHNGPTAHHSGTWRNTSHPGNATVVVNVDNGKGHHAHDRHIAGKSDGKGKTSGRFGASRR